MASLPPITNNPDARYLGRLLGEVIRAYGGEALYQRTEAIRAASVERHRTGEAADLGLEAMSLDEAAAFTRGFMMFSMLANLAEDRQGVAAEPGADVANSGRVEFKDVGDRGTVVTATIAYDPPAGIVGKIIAKMFQREPAIQARRDLRRFKQLMETGEIATASRTQEQLKEERA